MRAVPVACLLVFVLTTPAVAADADSAPAPQLESGDAGVATAIVATETPHTRRPAALPRLYAGYAALQLFDVYATERALTAGAREANPFMKPVVASSVGFVALKAGATAASIMAAEGLWKHDHRAAAVGLMIASTVVMGIVAAQNAKVLAGLE